MQVLKSLTRIWGSGREQVKGIVDTMPFTYILGKAELVRSERDPAQQLELLRRIFWRGTTGKQLVVRPRLCEEPWEHCLVPVELNQLLRLGDEVEVEIEPLTPPNSNDVPLEEQYLLGWVTRLISIFGQEPRELKDRAEWREVRRQEQISPKPLLKGRLGRILKLVNAAPSKGDGIILTGVPESGKSRFLGEFAGEAAEADINVVYALVGERDKDIQHAQRFLGGLPGVNLFGVAGTEGPLAKIRTVELALHYSMRRAELGQDILFVLDSATKGLAGPITENLPPPKGVGIQKGGLNPLARDALVISISITGAPVSGGSITTLVSLLDRGGPLDIALINAGRDTGDAMITLSFDARTAGVYPPFLLGQEEILQEGRRRRLARTSARGQGDWSPNGFQRAAAQLTQKLSLETCYEEVAENRAGDRVDRRVFWGEALEMTTDRLQQLVELVDRGADDATIFKDFNILYKPPDPEPEAADLTLQWAQPSDQDLTQMAKQWLGLKEEVESG